MQKPRTDFCIILLEDPLLQIRSDHIVNYAHALAILLWIHFMMRVSTAFAPVLGSVVQR